MRLLLDKALHRLRLVRFERKVSLMLAASILVTALSLLAVTTGSAINSLTQKSRNLAALQVESLSLSMENAMNDYRDHIIMLMLDDRIQAYLKAGGAREGYTVVTSEAYRSISYIRGAKPSIEYIMVAREDESETYLYSGINLFYYATGAQPRASDYAAAHPAGLGTLRYRMDELTDGRRMLHLYQPVYDAYRVNRRIGILCMGIGEDTLGQFCGGGSELGFSIHIADREGRALYAPERKSAGERESFAGKLTGQSGVFNADGDMVLHNRLGRWNIRLIGRVSLSELLSDSYATAFLMLILIAVLTVVSLLVSTRLIHRLCGPLREAVLKMQAVSKGDLDARMNEENIGNDFKEISVNFNSMTVRLRALMEMVKLEERRVQEIRFNVLQNQIQPHFLYNTLECIRWQAAAGGNRNVADMVKTLASYYRLCLSSGQDVIPLGREIELIKNYVTIQNTRYDNIVEFICETGEELDGVTLPKMTLQPLVENAIYHGVKGRGGSGAVRLSAQCEDGGVVLVLSDNGAGMTPEKIDEINGALSESANSVGYGVWNVHIRIELLFGKGYGLRYRANEAGGVTVEIKLPRAGALGPEALTAIRR